MQQTHYADRNGCALHGVIKVLDAIEGVVPIAHTNAGCSLNARFSANGYNGAAGRYFHSPLETSATTLLDKHVVFGGTARLREQIKNTVKVLKGDLYVVATGCVPEIIGDDVPAMVKEAREQQFPVLSIAAPGFKGHGYRGYAVALKTLFASIDDIFPAGAEPVDNRINLLGLVPELDPFWEGDLLELERILIGAGLDVNRLLGVGQDVDTWKSARHARLNLVLSPWGNEAADYLQQRYDIPSLRFGWLPIGSRDIGLLLDQVSQALVLDREQLHIAKNRIDSRSRYFLQKATSTWLRHDLQKSCAIVAGSAYAVGLARFLAGTLGQPLELVVITDEPDPELQAGLTRAIHHLAPDTRVQFASSQQEIAGVLIAAAPEFIFGSHLEQETARRLQVPLLEISTPVRQGLILTRTYAGERGALALIEDFSSAVFMFDAAAVSSV